MAAPYRVELAGPHQVDAVWLQVTYGLEHACRKTGGDLTSDYLWAECRAGRAYLVAVAGSDGICGASVHRFEQWTSGRRLRCLCLYGRDYAAWHDDHLRLVKEMARAGGATALVTDGRLGWQRMFPEAKVIKQTIEVGL